MKDDGESVVLRRLEEEAGRLRHERYPGDLMEDIRPRLAARRRGRRAWPWLLPAAAVLAVAAWRVQRRPPPPPPLPAALASGLSPFRTVRVPQARGVPLPSLSATGVPSVSTALRGGALAFSRMRPPPLTSPNKEAR